MHTKVSEKRCALNGGCSNSMQQKICTVLYYPFQFQNKIYCILETSWTKYIKIPNPKCRLYWYLLIEFIGWRYSQSCWYFQPAL
jgi:hypothetical protein